MFHKFVGHGRGQDILKKQLSKIDSKTTKYMKRLGIKFTKESNFFQRSLT